MRTLSIISAIFVLLLVGTGATMVTAEAAAVSQAGNSSVYFFDIAATDTHGTGKLMINLKQHKFVFNGKDFNPDKYYFLYYNNAGIADVSVFASAVATPSGNLHIEGEWPNNAAELLPAPGDFGVSGTVITNVLIANFVSVVENKTLMIQTGADIKAGKMASGGGGFKGSSMVFALVNMAVSKYRYNNIMDELNLMDDKVDQLLLDMAAIQSQLASIEVQIDGLQNWMINDVTLGQPMRDAEAWLAQYYSEPTQPQTSYNWALWELAGCDVSASTCTATVTDASSEAFNTMYYTDSVSDQQKDPPTLVTQDFYLWWAYAVQGTQAGGIPPYKQNGNTANNLIQSLHDGMIPDPITGQAGLRSYMEFVYSKSACATDVTACDLFSQVYLPLEAYFQQLITDQITLAGAVVESYAVLAATHQATHQYDSSVSDYMTGFQQKLSDEAEAFVEVAEQIALYRAADGRFDWSSFNTSDAAELLARADFVAARLVKSATGKPWAWPPDVTGRIFYTEQQTVPSTTVHVPLTEVVPMPQDFACKTSSSYSGQCVLTGDWPYLQWSAPDSSNVVSGTPTYTWKLRRIAQQQMAAGTYQVASINTQYGSASLVVSQYGDDYSNPPAAGTTPVLFGSFNEVEGSLGIGALDANRTYSGGGDDSVHDFTVSPLANDTQMNLTYKWYSHTGPTISADWYEKIKIKLTAVSGSFARARVFWPNTVAISLGSKYAGQCCDKYYQSLYQTLQLLNSSGSAVSGVNQTWHNCGSSDFTSCSYSSTDDNGPTLLASLPVALTANQTYTLQARYHDTIQYYCGSVYCYCTQSASSGSHVTWDLFNPTVVLVK